MASSFTIGKQEFTIQYVQARIVHSNKYNQNAGIYLSHLFFSNFLHDIVFEFQKTREKHAFTLTNVQVPVYPGQEVTLIAVNYLVVGYIDDATREYYYLTNNLVRALGWGVSRILVLLVPLLLFLVASRFLAFENEKLALVFLALVPLYWVYEAILNYYIGRQIDRAVTRG
jgi:hypothetical protein